MNLLVVVLAVVVVGTLVIMRKQKTPDPRTAAGVKVLIRKQLGPFDATSILPTPAEKLERWKQEHIEGPQPGAEIYSTVATVGRVYKIWEDPAGLPDTKSKLWTVKQVDEDGVWISSNDDPAGMDYSLSARNFGLYSEAKVSEMWF